MIPKIIHYCWFGKNPIPERLQKCIDSWKRIMPEYQIIEWNESNCNFQECNFVKDNYELKNYAFVSDYYRLKALYEMGGIYMDTDVITYKPFNDLLEYPCFLGFNYDCCIGTAVIGAEKGSKFIGELIDLYNKTVITNTKNESPLDHLKWENESLLADRLETNNYYFTWHVINHYPNVLLNNTQQKVNEFILFPKEEFEIGRLFNSYHTIHLNDGSWRKNHVQKKTVQLVKKVASKNERIYRAIQILARKRRYRKSNKKLPFYEYSQMKH